MSKIQYFKPNIYWALILAVLTAFLGMPFQYVAATEWNGALMKGNGPAIYMVFNNQKRLIKNERVFLGLGFKFKNVQRVRNSSLEYYTDGAVIDNVNVYPDGTLLQDKNGYLYLVENGVRRWIPHESIMQSARLNKHWAIRLNDQKLKKIPVGKIMRVADIYLSSSLLEDPNGLDTFILNKANSVSDEKLIIKYGGHDTQNPHQLLTYATYIPIIDNYWSLFTSATQREINLTKYGGDTVTVYVKARNIRGQVDTTPAMYTFTVNISPFYGKIKINGLTLREQNPNKEQITLVNKSNTSVNILGWSLTGRNNNKHVLPTIAIKPFNPSNNPIVLPPNVYLDIFTGMNPVSNLAGGFRLNKCIGYLNNIYNINPPVNPDNCPLPSREDIEPFTFECQKFMLQRTSNCKSDYSIVELQQADILNDAPCIEYINKHLNYHGCVQDYQFDSNFYLNDWRLYLGYSRDIWQNLGESIVLRDQNDMLVDTFKIRDF